MEVSLRMIMIAVILASTFILMSGIVYAAQVGDGNVISNKAYGGTAQASSWGAVVPPDKIVDDLYDTTNGYFQTGEANQDPFWVRITLASPVAVNTTLLWTYPIGIGSNWEFTDYKIYGSNDCIDNETDCTWALITTQVAQPDLFNYTYNFTNDVAYQWYLFNVTKWDNGVGGGGGCALMGLWLYNLSTDLITNTAPVVDWLNMSPANNSQQNTLSVPFFYNVTDADDDQVNCTFFVDGVVNQTQTNVTLNQTTTNFTLAFDSNEEGTFTLIVGCTDGQEDTNGTIKTFHVDNVDPSITINDPINDTIYINGSLSLDVQFNDPNLYTVGISIYNSSESVYTYYNATVGGETSHNFTDSVVTSTWSLNYTIKFNATDSHTNNKLKKNWTTSKSLVNKKLSFDIDGDYVDIKLKTSPKTLNSITTDKKQDRISFTFDVVIDGTELYYEFEIDTNLDLDYLSESEYGGHLVIGNKYWLDFDLVNAQYSIDKKNKNKYVLGIWTDQQLSFNSIGELNYIEKLFSLTIDKDIPVITLVTPLNNSNLTTTPITYTYNVTDIISVDNCTYSLDGLVNSTNTSITNYGNSTFSNIPTINYHNWSISCLDSVGHEGTSDTFYFNLTQITTTNVTELNISKYGRDWVWLQWS